MYRFAGLADHGANLSYCISNQICLKMKVRLGDLESAVTLTCNAALNDLASDHN